VCISGAVGMLEIYTKRKIPSFFREFSAENGVNIGNMRDEGFQHMKERIDNGVINRGIKCE
jgi:hypothetical protein